MTACVLIVKTLITHLKHLFFFITEAIKRILNFTAGVYSQEMVSCISFSYFFYVFIEWCRCMWLHWDCKAETCSYFAFNYCEFSSLMAALLGGVLCRASVLKPPKVTVHSNPTVLFSQMHTTGWITSPPCVKAAKENRAFFKRCRPTTESHWGCLCMTDKSPPAGPNGSAPTAVITSWHCGVLAAPSQTPAGQGGSTNDK